VADSQITFDQFKEQWLSDVTIGDPSTVELGRRFARKIVAQWLDTDEASSDLVYCDGSGDGGIDIAYLDRGDEPEESSDSVAGHTWYLVQSKFGSAFQGKSTLLTEGQKLIETLDGRRQNLSSLAEGLLERLTNFRKQASEIDRLVLVMATVDPLSEPEQQCFRDLQSIGRERLGPVFGVDSVSVETIFERAEEDEQLRASQARRFTIEGSLVPCGDNLLVGSIPLIDLYNFLKAYRDRTQDLDALYEKNVRRFLGARGKVNKGMQDTLRQAPEHFGLYNNGITLVVSDFKPLSANTVELVEPYIVNGCRRHGRFGKSFNVTWKPAALGRTRSSKLGSTAPSEES